MIIKLVGGLFTLGIGVRQARQVPRWRPGGVRASGSVVRMHQEWNAEENVWGYAPVVTFRDEHGTSHEFTTGTMTTWTSHERGEQVTVLYPPGRPEAARLKSASHSALWLVSPVLSAIFILVGLALLGSFALDLR